MNRPTILETREGPVATITLNRPDALNALSVRMEAELTAALTTLDADPSVRAVIVTGAGRAFCAGVDLKELTEGDTLATRVWHGPGGLGAAMAGMQTPVIAAVNGFAVTGGLELALNADFILAAPAARFADTHARVGITPAWGMTHILPRLIGPARARLMSLTGRYVTAAEAHDWGLVAELTGDDDLMARARAIGAEIAETDPVVAGVVRRLIGQSGDLTAAAAASAEIAAFDDHIATVGKDGLTARRAAVQARGARIAGAET